MDTITYERKHELINEANAKLREAFPMFSNVRAIEIVDSGLTGFNPTISWLGTCGNSASTASEFALALAFAAELVT